MRVSLDGVWWAASAPVSQLPIFYGAALFLRAHCVLDLASPVGSVLPFLDSYDVAPSIQICGPTLSPSAPDTPLSLGAPREPVALEGLSSISPTPALGGAENVSTCECPPLSCLFAQSCKQPLFLQSAVEENNRG